MNIGEDSSTTSSKVLDARELRIGNWVTGDKNWNGNYIPFQVNLIEDCDYGDLIKPIPLNEEWLLRFGFDAEDSASWSSGNKQPYKVYRNGLFTYNGIQSAWWYNGQVLQKQPEFVHQLQNLYYALTGNELIFNHG